MSEKKLRRVLTSIAVTASLGLTATATGNASERTGWRPERLRVVKEVESLPALDIWSLLNRLWEKSGARIDPNGGKSGARIDPNGAPTEPLVDPDDKP